MRRNGGAAACQFGAAECAEMAHTYLVRDLVLQLYIDLLVYLYRVYSSISTFLLLVYGSVLREDYHTIHILSSSLLVISITI